MKKRSTKIPREVLQRVGAQPRKPTLRGVIRDAEKLAAGAQAARNIAQEQMTRASTFAMLLGAMMARAGGTITVTREELEAINPKGPRGPWEIHQEPVDGGAATRLTMRFDEKPEGAP